MEFGALWKVYERLGWITNYNWTWLPYLYKSCEALVIDQGSSSKGKDTNSTYQCIIITNYALMMECIIIIIMPFLLVSFEWCNYTVSLSTNIKNKQSCYSYSLILHNICICNYSSLSWPPFTFCTATWLLFWQGVLLYTNKSQALCRTNSMLYRNTCWTNCNFK